jgi:uncharacterized protein YggE
VTSKGVGIGLAGIALGVVVALSLPSTAQSTDDRPTERTISVSGSARLDADPDEAVVRLGVRTQAATAQDAMDQNSAKMARVIAALRELGLGDEDLATSTLNLSPRYEDRGRSLVGYDASNDVQATIRDLASVGRVIDAAVGAGADVAGGIQFRLSDENQGVDRALAAAVENAKAKADAMASAAGTSVGQVVTIAEQGRGSYGDERFGYAADFEAAAVQSVPIEVPTIDTQVTVSVTWALQ